MKKYYWLIAIFLILVLTGCSHKDTHAIDIYTLKYNKSSNLKHTVYFTDKTLKIALPKSTKEIRRDKILYTKTTHQREAYAYSRWSDTPNHMTMQFLVTLLNQHKLFKAVIPESSIADSQLLLESNIEDFYQFFDKENQSFGIVKIQCFLIDQKSKKIISKHYFDLKIPSSSANAKGGVQALNLALEQIASQLITWLAQHLKKI